MHQLLSYIKQLPSQVIATYLNQLQLFSYYIVLAIVMIYVSVQCSVNYIASQLACSSYVQYNYGDVFIILIDTQNSLQEVVLQMNYEYSNMVTQIWSTHSHLLCMQVDSQCTSKTKICNLTATAVQLYNHNNVIFVAIYTQCIVHSYSQLS